MSKIAIVTGASSGLGEEFIKNLGNEDIDEIWAIARRRERLEALANISSVPVRPVPMDLTDKENISRLSEMLSDEKPEIHILINAAGFGKIGLTEDIGRDSLDKMIDLNCRAAVDVTLLCIPYMPKGSRILEICSTAAFQPFQFLNVYAASKAFLYRFSRALYIELRPKKISVTAVCPYWIRDTEFIPTARSGRNNTAIRHFPLSSKKKSVARIALNDSRLRLPVSTPGIMCTLHRIAAKFIPSCLMCLIWSGLRRI
ncbi:MAG TPA: SDR family NAD(P)-dependent oxidoreductase [Candidatus Alectryocaccobium stercorigallinarum]|nr:SDR family NAD(P)-dependent oxidoreductase [Candidatus Alectryocaccobium stercorigallinarum]